MNPLMKKNIGILKVRKMFVNTVCESIEMVATCPNTTRNIEKPRRASIYPQSFLPPPDLRNN